MKHSGTIALCIGSIASTIMVLKLLLFFAPGRGSTFAMTDVRVDYWLSAHLPPMLQTLIVAAPAGLYFSLRAHRAKLPHAQLALVLNAFPIVFGAIVLLIVWSIASHPPPF
jgi:hypothetical protein